MSLQSTYASSSGSGQTLMSIPPKQDNEPIKIWAFNYRGHGMRVPHGDSEDLIILRGRFVKKKPANKHMSGRSLESLARDSLDLTEEEQEVPQEGDGTVKFMVVGYTTLEAISKCQSSSCRWNQLPGYVKRHQAFGAVAPPNENVLYTSKKADEPQNWPQYVVKKANGVRNTGQGLNLMVLMQPENGMCVGYRVPKAAVWWRAQFRDTVSIEKERYKTFSEKAVVLSPPQVSNQVSAYPASGTVQGMLDVEAEEKKKLARELITQLEAAKSNPTLTEGVTTEIVKLVERIDPQVLDDEGATVAEVFCDPEHDMNDDEDAVPLLQAAVRVWAVEHPGIADISASDFLLLRKMMILVLEEGHMDVGYHLVPAFLCGGYGAIQYDPPGMSDEELRRSAGRILATVKGCVAQVVPLGKDADLADEPEEQSPSSFQASKLAEVLTMVNGIIGKPIDNGEETVTLFPTTCTPPPLARVFSRKIMIFYYFLRAYNSTNTLAKRVN